MEPFSGRPQRMCPVPDIAPTGELEIATPSVRTRVQRRPRGSPRPSGSGVRLIASRPRHDGADPVDDLVAQLGALLHEAREILRDPDLDEGERAMVTGTALGIEAVLSDLER